MADEKVLTKWYELGRRNDTSFLDLAHEKGKFSSDTMQKVNRTIHVAEKSFLVLLGSAKRNDPQRER